MKIEEVKPTAKKCQPIFNGPYWEDFCPSCDEPAVSGCRCFINDRVCKNGHEWHRVNGIAVKGSGHGKR